MNLHVMIAVTSARHACMQQTANGQVECMLRFEPGMIDQGSAECFEGFLSA